MLATRSLAALALALAIMSRRRSLLAAAALLVAAGAASVLAASTVAAAGTSAVPAPASAPRHPAAVAAEEAFFAAFNGGGRRDAPLVPLMRAWAADSRDARTNLLLGLDHLWIATEGDRQDARAIEHLLLAEVFLTRAQELDPTDDRIASWLVPTRLALAGVRRDGADAEAIHQELVAAYLADPAFHGFSVAMLAFSAAPGTPSFERGLRALDEVAAMECGDGDPSCRNHPRWPHNVEGYLTFNADYRLKAGEREAAAELLARVRAMPSYPAWPFREEVEDRLRNIDLYAELYANDDPGDDPPSLIASHGCRSCHLGASAAP